MQNSRDSPTGPASTTWSRKTKRVAGAAVRIVPSASNCSIRASRAPAGGRRAGRALFRAFPGVLARIVELDECFGKARSGDPRALGLGIAAATVVPACGCEPASRELPFDAPPIEAVFRERGAGLSVAELGLHVLAECARMVGDHQAVPAESFVLARFMLEPAEQSLLGQQAAHRRQGRFPETGW